MSKIVYQFAHGVLIAGEQHLTQPSDEYRDPTDAEQPVNPFAESVQDDQEVAKSESNDEPKSEAVNTEEPKTAPDSEKKPAESTKK